MIMDICSGASNKSFHFCHSELGATPRRRDLSWACRPLLVARTRVGVDFAGPAGEAWHHASQNVKVLFEAPLAQRRFLITILIRLLRSWFKSPLGQG